MTQDLTKKIADLRTAIDKTEFPPMDEIGALGAQVHLLGNEEQKRQVAEMAGQAEYGAKFMTLPQAQRDEITARWREKLKNGATAYERHLADTVQTANQRVTDAWQRDPYDAAARYSEGVTALPAIDWQSNTAPQVLAAKVAQQNTIRADQNMGAFSVLRPGESQSLAATLVNGDPKQGSQILRTLADTLPPDIYRATVSDAPVKAALDGMVRSYDPDRLNTAFSVLDRAYRADPVGFKATFGDTTLGRLQTWQAHKDSLSPVQMSEYFKRADDPAFATARKALEEEAEKKISGNTPEKVSNLLGSFADRNVPFVNQAPPTDPLSAGALVAEYDKLFKERFVDTRDEGKSRDQAVERLKTTWGQSSVAGGALMKYPPERFYPQVDGSYDWMKRDLDAAVGASRLGGVTNTVTAPGLTPDIPGAPSTVDVPAFSYRLLSDGRTEADVAGKRPPSYVVMVKDLATGRENIPLDWAGKPMRYSFDPANAQETARERFTTNRAAPDPFAGESNVPGFENEAQKKSEIMFEQRGGIAGFIDRWLGTTPTEFKADGLSAYPNDADAEFARKYGFGYGSRLEPYINQEVSRVLGESKFMRGESRGGGTVAFSARSGAGSYLDQVLSTINDETKSKNLDLTKPENAEIKLELGNTYAKAALAVNRIPIAALGFDPSRVVMDAKMKNANVGGAYSPELDAIYSNLSSPGNLVHESIHRGIEKLRQDPDLKSVFKDLPREELVVRYLMATQAGNPEQGSGSIGDQQREQALYEFDKGLGSQRNKVALEKLTKAAQDLIGKRRGPV
jgi:hypothetical protein